MVGIPNEGEGDSASKGKGGVSGALFNGSFGITVVGGTNNPDKTSLAGTQSGAVALHVPGQVQSRQKWTLQEVETGVYNIELVTGAHSPELR